MEQGKTGNRATAPINAIDSQYPVVDSINRFASISKFLDDQLSECQGRIKQHSSKNSDKLASVPLEEDIHFQKSNVLESKARLSLQDDVIKTFLYGQQIMQSFQSEVMSSDKEDEIELYHTLNATLMSKLEIVDKISTQIATISEDVKAMQLSSLELDLELYKSIQKNKKNLEHLRELVKKRSMPKSHRKIEDDYPFVRKQRERLEFKITKLKQVKHIFQSLIHASKVDWYEDKELCDMMIKLGE